MAALVQTLPQQTATVMLSSRPSSSGGFSSSQSQHNQGRSSSTQRYTYAAAAASYRGMSGSSSLVAPYAFTSTPQLATRDNASRQQTPHLRSENRTSSAPVLPPLQHLQQSASPGSNMSPRQQFESLASSQKPLRSLDDNSISLRQAAVNNPGRPKSMLNMPLSIPTTSIASSQVHKNSPDRYRRNVRRGEGGDSGPNRVHHSSAQPSGSGMAAVGSLYSQQSQTNSSPAFNTYHSYRGTVYNTAAPYQASVDDMTPNRTESSELAKRYRRRSLGTPETAGSDHSESTQDTASPHPNASAQPVGPRTDSRAWQAQPAQTQSQTQQQRPGYAQSKTGSSDSISSVKSARSSPPSSAKNETSSVSSYTPSAGTLQLTPIVKQDGKLGNPPSRIVDQTRRTPSPLSRPDNMNLDAQKQQIPQVMPPSSSAADHLNAVSKKDEKKSKSKLRRAFSFGSASELRRASAQNNLDKSAAETSKANKRNSKYEDEMEPEEAKVARDQEAGGLGESIYSGQGRFFTGSTDNLSVSSTASSASIMLRKMGKGVKKSTRSLVGLFRPKSVVGVPAADGPLNQASAAQVSMVTVEAEREKVNVNLDPHDQPGGGTGFPKLERNSIDAKQSTDSGTLSSDTRSRRSIAGGERERAEVLAAVKKGILKRNDSNQSQASPQLNSYDFKTPDFNLPTIPNMVDSPHSSAPSTPRDESTPRNDHRRTDSITVQGTGDDDYFNSITYAASIDHKGSLLSRNISFSPRIQFHDTWPGTEYDRRGEIATCNRLTPMLAQQIKEELNTFKMEMEVHESSKVYTHFF